MIGLSFLAVALLWLALAFYLTAKLPLWLGLKKLIWPLRIVLLSILLVGPFVDEIVGMRQFRALCEEQTTISVSSDAGSVRRARDISVEKQILPGYWINIWASRRTYFDLDTGKEFLSYPVYRTQGGRVAGLALLGGWHFCSAESSDNRNNQQFKNLNAYELLSNGRKK